MTNENNPYELYSGYELLSEATEHIRIAIDLAEQDVRLKFMTGSKTLDYYIGRAWMDVISPVLGKYRKGGATDTEPVCITERELFSRFENDALSLPSIGRW